MKKKNENVTKMPKKIMGSSNLKQRNPGRKKKNKIESA
jgi:hypothetical protein